MKNANCLYRWVHAECLPLAIQDGWLAIFREIFRLKLWATSAKRLASTGEIVLLVEWAAKFRSSTSSSRANSSSRVSRSAFRRLAIRFGVTRLAARSLMASLANCRSKTSNVFHSSITTPIGLARNATRSLSASVSSALTEYLTPGASRTSFGRCRSSVVVGECGSGICTASACTSAWTSASTFASTFAKPSLNFAETPPGRVSSDSLGMRSMISFLNRPTMNAAAVGQATADTKSVMNLRTPEAFKSQKLLAVVTGSSMSTSHF